MVGAAQAPRTVSPCGLLPKINGLPADAVASLIAAAAALLPHARMGAAGSYRAIPYTTAASPLTAAGAGQTGPIELLDSDPSELQFVSVFAKIKAAPAPVISRLYLSTDGARLAVSDDGAGDPWVAGAADEVLSGVVFSTLLLPNSKLVGAIVGPVAGTTGTISVHRVTLSQILGSMEGVRRDLARR